MQRQLLLIISVRPLALRVCDFLCIAIHAVTQLSVPETATHVRALYTADIYTAYAEVLPIACS